MEKEMTLLRIEIIGTEDTQQKMLLHNVKEALKLLGIQLGVDVRIVLITEWEDILHYDIIQTPVLVIRNQVLSQGFIPSILELKKIIKAFIPDELKSLKPIHH